MELPGGAAGWWREQRERLSVSPSIHPAEMSKSSEVDSGIIRWLGVSHGSRSPSSGFGLTVEVEVELMILFQM